MHESEQLIVISTAEEISSLINYLSDKDFVAYDCETTGLEDNAEIVGLSVCAEPTKAYYIITAIWDPEDKQLIRLENKVKVIELLTLLQTKNLITHNGLVDWRWTLVNYGVQLKDATFHDTMISGHLLDENNSNALKERAKREFGEDATKEQQEMKVSVIANGGVWQDKRGGNKEMYKADPFILGLYGAKDTILTFKLFLLDTVSLDEQNLTEYFYNLECMPLWRTVTWDLNTTGIKVDEEKLKALGEDLRKEINELKANILSDIDPYVRSEYPGTNKKNQFNIGSSNQMAWLLFVVLDNKWKKLTPAGKKLSKELINKIPYTDADKKRFCNAVKTAQDSKGRPYKLHKYIQCDKSAVASLAERYKWCSDLLKYSKATKMLNTYVDGISKQVSYGVVHPQFLQIGTRGSRFSSKSPNFQNLVRDDKRVKSCMISRAGKVFVGADASQIEARVFASFSGDYELQQCFARGEDFYSVIGMRVFNKTDCTPFKEGSPEAFGIKYKKLRQISKTVALAVCYGAEAPRMNDILGLPMEECQRIIDSYWEAYPTLKDYVDKQHKSAVETGTVYSLFGRPRRLPEAKFLKQLGWPNMHRIPGDLKTYLNMSVNQPIQITAGTLMNLAAIAFHKKCQDEGIVAPLVCQVHDSLIAECLEKDASRVAEIMQYAMEKTTEIPGVLLEAKPLIGRSLAEV